MASQIQNNFRARKSFARSRRLSISPTSSTSKSRATRSSCRRICRWNSERIWAARRVQERLSHQGLLGNFVHRVRQLHARQTQVRRGRVPSAGHDLCGTDQGDGASGGVGHQRGDRLPVHSRRQGARGVLRRDPADDRQRDLHHQRHREGGGEPAPPQSGRFL